MDTETYSAAEVARRLETSIPRVVRHVEKLGFRARTPSGRLCLTPQMLSRLEEEMGYTPRAPGLSTPQVRALAALREAPFGLASARAVARRAGLSPTAASRALETLEQKRLIYCEETMIAAGRARSATIYHANPLAEGWNQIEPFLRKTRLEESTRRRDETVPSRLRHLFWNAAPEQLIVADAGPYIARRILIRFDLDGLSWGARNLKASDWRRAAEARGLDPRTRALALNIARESDDEAKGKTPGLMPASARTREEALAPALRKVLPAATARAWQELCPILPRELYLIGGTAVAVHLGHRESRDLDFFFHERSVDLAALRARIESRGEFAVTDESPGTLCGLYGPTKVEFFHADEAAPQHLLEEPTVIAGLRVASLRDLMAMKLKVVRDRAEMRDYFDLKAIDGQGGVSVEEGLGLFLARYDAKVTGEEIRQVIRSLGYLDDVDEDKTLPITKEALAKWWASRQVAVVRHFDRYYF